MTRKRLRPEIRKNEILGAALDLAVVHGYQQVTRDQIAAHIGITGTAVQYHFSTIAKLRRAVMRHAVSTRCIPVVTQGIALKDTHALAASQDLRDEVVKAFYDALVSKVPNGLTVLPPRAKDYW